MVALQIIVVSNPDSEKQKSHVLSQYTDPSFKSVCARTCVCVCVRVCAHVYVCMHVKS